MELLLIRHALPVRLESATGPVDPELAPLGVDQAERLARWLATEPIDALYSSPMRRARETARPLADATGLAPTVVDELAEWDRDSHAYIPIEEVRAAKGPAWLRLSSGRREDLADLGIDPDAFVERVVTTIDSIASAHAGQRVAVVCHGGVINAYCSALLRLDRLLFFSPDYTSITRILVGGGVRSIGSLNELGHLH